MLNHTATLHLARGNPQQARAHHQHALELAPAMHSQLEEARALEGLGRFALAMGNIDTATLELRQALEIYQRIGAADASRLAAELDGPQETHPTARSGR